MSAMSALPRVTAIIIVYNGAEFLDESIASVRAQTYRDWELLIVDDGSSDGSREIAVRHASDDSRIELLEHPDRRNHGMSATRNLGLARARGEFVGFNDADDVWLPSKLEEQVAAFDEHPEVAMVYGRSLIWHSWEPGTGSSDYFYDLGVTPDRVVAPPTLFRNLLRNEFQTPTPCNALMRRSAMLAIGGSEASFGGMFEDQVLFAKLLVRYPVFVSDRCWAKYRQHDRSATAISAASGADHAFQLHYLHWLRRYLAEREHAAPADRIAVERTIAAVHYRHAMRRMRRRAADVLRRR
jgi:glycosyltransferase involved in cell wall biosynthesis